MKKDVQFSRGKITLTINNSHPNWDVESLLGFAERINPKRAFLFVSKVLGKHIPVTPSQITKSHEDLASLIPSDLPSPVTVVGMAETAVCLGAGIYRQLKDKNLDESVFVTTTRHPAPDLPKLSNFLEEHSHAQDQVIYSSNDKSLHDIIIASKTLILVDDEISTGKTFKNLIKSLSDAGLNQVERIILVSLVNWNDGKLENEFLGIPMQSIALLNGNLQWIPNNKLLEQAMPDVSTTATGCHKVIAPITWGREPSNLTVQPWGAVQTDPSEKILILGSCEFTWLPFLLAEQLEKDGFNVYFSSTTRSPIMQGHAIQSICNFQDNYGLGINNYVYNVIDQDFDRVFLFLETAKESVDPNLFKQIPNLEVISYV